MAAAATTAENHAGHLRALAATSPDGTLSVETFMREALYHPRWGYYAGAERQTPRVGRTGDFSTAATLHPALGQAVAAWAWAHRREVMHPGSGVWHVIELGGGNGQLAAAFLEKFGWWRRRKLRYGIVEISPSLRQEQQTRLARWQTTGTASWHDDIGAALAAANGRALVFSNEFVDAFPCVQLVRDRAAPRGWHEVRLRWPEGATAPILLASVDLDARLADCGFFDECAMAAFADGQHVEVHRAYREWLTDALLPRWRAGRLLTIDYGDELPALYHRRPRGTLRAYARHLRFDPGDPAIFTRPGQQDLTADVNFSDLRRWGRALGLREATGPLLDQRAFLLRWLPQPPVADAIGQFLLDPAGAGGAIKVLEQIRVDAAVSADGVGMMRWACVTHIAPRHCRTTSRRLRFPPDK
ncbi:MAG: SAM-dependent methyltransferase [Verrucomicrobia bacterium]|nr:SAM-dependent methyltransferase [Verrucomicrobiota bacterium]